MTVCESVAATEESELRTETTNRGEPGRRQSKRYVRASWFMFAPAVFRADLVRGEIGRVCVWTVNAPWRYLVSPQALQFQHSIGRLIGGRGHAEDLPELHHLAGQPVQFEAVAALQIVQQRRLEAGRSGFGELHAVVGKIG